MAAVEDVPVGARLDAQRRVAAGEGPSAAAVHLALVDGALLVGVAELVVLAGACAHEGCD